MLAARYLVQRKECIPSVHIPCSAMYTYVASVIILEDTDVKVQSIRGGLNHEVVDPGPILGHLYEQPIEVHV